MLKMILCSIPLVISATHASSTVSFGAWEITADGSGYAEILWASDETLVGFQFDVGGATLTSAADGLTDKLDWIVSNNTFRVLGVAFTPDSYIPPQEVPVHLITLYFENVGDVISLSEAIFVNKASEVIEVDASDEIITAPACDADLNGDSVVNVIDLLEVIDFWGLSDVPADINDDGVVDVIDLLLLVSVWGPC